MFLPPFEGPFAKLEHAGHHLVELYCLVRAYQKTAKPSFVKTEREIDPWQIATDPPVPVSIALTIGDIAHSLRSALDVMLCDIAALRQVGLSDMKFPFFDSELTFQERMAGSAKNAPFKKLGGDVVRLISEYRPYKDGNALLRGLHDLNNQDKHRMVIPSTIHSVAGVSLHTMLMSALDEQANNLSPGSLTERENINAAREKNYVVISPFAPTVSLGEGEPLSKMFYREHPADGLSLGADKPTIVFPQHYFLSGEVCSVMSRITDSTFEMVERFRRLAQP